MSTASGSFGPKTQITHNFEARENLLNSVGIVRQQLSRLGVAARSGFLHRVPVNEGTLSLYVGRQGLQPGSLDTRIVLNREYDNSYFSFRGIFVDDIVIGANGLGHQHGFIELTEDGNLPDIGCTEELNLQPPVIWLDNYDRPYLDEGSAELETTTCADLPMTPEQYLDTLAREAIASDVASLLSRLHPTNFQT